MCPDNTNPPKVDLEQAKAFFSRLRDANHNEETSSNFMPFVLIRSCAGDNVSRPLPAGSPPFWESPDIWTALGDPNKAPEVPSTQGGTVEAGKPNTVYAHVWNLGRAPVAGAKVEWFWFNPALGINGAHAHSIGSTRVDLSPRGFPGCHRLVKCPQAWVPVLENGGHECVVARISALGDPLNGAHEWDAWADRHVAQRNLSVVPAKSDVMHIIRSLDATRPAMSTVRLYQAGADAAETLQLAAPHLTLDPAVKTNLLAELGPDNKLNVPSVSLNVPRVMPHILMNLGPKPPIHEVKQPMSDNFHTLHDTADIPVLLHHGNLLSEALQRKLDVLPPPKQGQAQVIRIASIQNGITIGGYTIVIAG